MLLGKWCSKPSKGGYRGHPIFSQTHLEIHQRKRGSKGKMAGRPYFIQIPKQNGEINNPKTGIWSNKTANIDQHSVTLLCSKPGLWAFVPSEELWFRGKLAKGTAKCARRSRTGELMRFVSLRLFVNNCSSFFLFGVETGGTVVILYLALRWFLAPLALLPTGLCACGLRRTSIFVIAVDKGTWQHCPASFDDQSPGGLL